MTLSKQYKCAKCGEVYFTTSSFHSTAPLECARLDCKGECKFVSEKTSTLPVDFPGPVTTAEEKPELCHREALTTRTQLIMDNVRVAISANNREQSISHREEVEREVESLERETIVLKGLVREAATALDETLDMLRPVAMHKHVKSWDETLAKLKEAEK